MATQSPITLSWDVLKSLGFVEDKTLFSDPPGGLSFDFGNFKLSAIVCVNRWLQPVIRLSGVMSTRLTTTEVESEMPQEVESREQAIAFVTWCLDHHSDDVKFQPGFPISWLQEGRRHQGLLPWERERMESERKQVAFAARPGCLVDREWMRVALHKLHAFVESAADEAAVTLEFDGDVLKIRCSTETLAMPASGKPWQFRFSIPSGNLRQLPKRLMDAKVDVSIWDGRLLVGHRNYPGVVKIEEKT
jgi:hypothetical protein